MRPIMMLLILLVATSACTKIAHKDDGKNSYLNPPPNNNDSRLAECNKLPATQIHAFGDTSNPRYGCYLDVAILQNDLIICEYLDGYWKDECIEGRAIASGNASICNKISHSSREGCISGVAVATSESSLCKSIKDQEMRWRCHAELAIQSSDLGLCKNIINETERDLTPAESRETWYSICLTNMAINTNNITLCKYFGLNLTKSGCLLEAEKCYELKDSELRTQCMYDSAWVSHIPS